MYINMEEVERLIKAQKNPEEAEALLEPIKELAMQRRYGLIWEEPKSGAYAQEDAENALSEHFPFLEELTDRAIIKDNNKESNLLIEGDNLHALQAMQYTHRGKVDVIYIDPPYNTGKMDFVYNDRFVDKEDSWRHSSWLSFMNKRLRLAKTLLSKEGVIFISIDDNEFAQLKLLSDQVFGDSNFIANFIWQKKKGGGNDSVHVATEHEYILLYAANKSFLPPFFGTYEDKYLSRYKERDDKGRYYWDTFRRKSGKQYYPITCPDGTILEYDEKGNPISWLRSEARFLRDKEEGEVRIVKNNGKWTVHFKQRLPQGKKPRTIVNNKGTTSDGSNEVLSIFNTNIFNNPKPIDLIKHLISLTSNSKAIVLDFFAGSGTTGQAVMELNNEDGGTRQFILCTNNEVSEKKEIEKLVDLNVIEAFTGRKNTKKYKEWLEGVEEYKGTEAYQDFVLSSDYQSLGIAHAITYERIKRVIEGYTTVEGERVEGLTNNFRHFRISLKEDYKDEEYNSYKLIGDTVDLIRLKENIFDNMVSISTNEIPVVKLYSDDKVIYIVLDTDVIDEDIAALIDTYPDDDSERVIYTNYTDYPYMNIRYEELPKEILRALKMKEMN